MSHHVTETMDLSALKGRYNGTIPDDVQEHVDKFALFAKTKGVKSVKLLSNFGKDVEMSLQHGTDVYRGLIVQVSDTYVIRKDDLMWMHPQLCKGRSMYDGGSKENNESSISSFNSSCGFYSTHHIDEIGGFTSKQCTIVDSYAQDESDTLLQSWILGSNTVKEAYQAISKNKLVHTSQFHRDKVAKERGAEKRLMNSNYNMLYSDGMSYHFFNHAIKPFDGKAIVHVSPLMGCATVTADKYIESDLLSSQDYIDVKTLKPEQRERAYVSCKWSGDNIINTYTMRKPIANYKSILDDNHATMYRMETGFFSSNPIHSKLPTDIVLFLTPEPKLIPENAPCREHIRDGSIDVPATVDNISKLMGDHWRALISKKYVNGDSLILPRSMVKSSLL